MIDLWDIFDSVQAVVARCIDQGRLLPLQDALNRLRQGCACKRPSTLTTCPMLTVLANSHHGQQL